MPKDGFDTFFAEENIRMYSKVCKIFLLPEILRIFEFVKYSRGKTLELRLPISFLLYLNCVLVSRCFKGICYAQKFTLKRFIDADIVGRNWIYTAAKVILYRLPL